MALPDTKVELEALWEAFEKAKKERIVTEVLTCKGIIRFTPDKGARKRGIKISHHIKKANEPKRTN